MESLLLLVKCTNYAIVKQVKTYPTKRLGGIKERSTSSKPLKRSCVSLYMIFSIPSLVYLLVALLVLIPLNTPIFDLIAREY